MSKTGGVAVRYIVVVVLIRLFVLSVVLFLLRVS